MIYLKVYRYLLLVLSAVFSTGNISNAFTLMLIGLKKPAFRYLIVS